MTTASIPRTLALVLAAAAFAPSGAAARSPRAAPRSRRARRASGTCETWSPRAGELEERLDADLDGDTSPGSVLSIVAPEDHPRFPDRARARS